MIFRFLRILNCQWIHFVRVSVTSEINFTVERSIANAAREWFEARMFPAVGDEIRRLAERLTALQTFMGLLACVDVCVFLHVGFLMESLATVVTREWPSV